MVRKTIHRSDNVHTLLLKAMFRTRLQGDVVVSNKSLKLVLIDGKQLARYMIKYNVGVISQHSYTIKRVDTGYFEGE